VTDGVTRRKPAAEQDQQPDHNNYPLSPQLALNKKVVTEPWSRLYKLQALIEKNAQSMPPTPNPTPDELFAFQTHLVPHSFWALTIWAVVRHTFRTVTQS
jgi:hypothetical protein